MPRPILLDGITIQLVGELLFDMGTEPVDRIPAHRLYGKALWDFGFAVLFGDTLGSVGSLGSRNGAFPGEAVVKYGGTELFKHVLPPAAGSPEDILVDALAKKDLAAELGVLHHVFAKNPSHITHWLDYIQIDSALNLTDQPVRSMNPAPGALFEFPGRKLKYLNDAELQNAIDQNFVRRLVLAVVEKHPTRAQDDMTEFVERVLLTHYAISRWYENSARAFDFTRSPFVTRSEVKLHTALAELDSRESSIEQRRVNVARFRLTSTALSEVFTRCRSDRRLDIYDELIASRDLYEPHRACLSAIDFYMRPDSYSAREILDACRNIDNLCIGVPHQTAIYSDTGVNSYFLLRSPTLSYPNSAFHAFPELNPVNDGSGYRRAIIYDGGRNMPEFSLEVFISHSSDDADLAKALIDVLRSALLIPANKIRCTSVDGYRLQGGADSDQTIKEEVRSAKVFVGLITPSSWASAYVLFELGARWGANLPLKPLLAGITPDKLGSPLRGLNALECSKEDQAYQFIEEIGNALNRKQESFTSFRSKLSDLVSRADTLNSKEEQPTRISTEIVGPLPPFGYFFRGADRENPLCPKCIQEKVRREAFLTPLQPWNGGLRRGCRLCGHQIYEKEMDLSPSRSFSRRPNTPWS